MLEAVGDVEGAKDARRKLREQRKAYRDYSEEHELAVHDDRLTVVKVKNGDTSYRNSYTSALDKSDGSGIIEMYRKGNTHRYISENNSQIIDKPTYNKITKPAIKSGADIRIADNEWLKHLQENEATAVTIGDVIYFRPDATVSDVLEEVHHFYQNKSGLNSEYSAKQRTILNEIDAKQYLLTQTQKYHISNAEVELTKKQLAAYIRQMEEMRERGEWVE